MREMTQVSGGHSESEKYLFNYWVFIEGNDCAGLRVQMGIEG